MPTSNSHYSLSDLSARFELELRGDGTHHIDGVGTLSSAGPSQISFFANVAYRAELSNTSAGAVILSADDAGDSPSSCLVSDDPYLSYARIAVLFDPRPVAPQGVHDTAVIDETARIGSSVSIGPHVVIGAGTEISEGCTLGPGTVIGAECFLGSGCHLHANVSVGHGVRLGQRVIIHPGAVIGADGFGIAFAQDHWEKVPQLGSVEIGDDCEIGANTCIDRGAIENTVLEEDVRLDNLVQIAHNVRIGAHTAIAGTAGVAGSAKIGRYCLFAGGGGVAGHLEIADRTTIAAASIAFRSISEPGTTWSSQIPAQPIREWQKNAARLRKLDQLARRISQLEKQKGKTSQNE
jgi:UDP-3-O-[3-hydroxymyristoyl] glucosamine N-acyltransferase